MTTTPPRVFRHPAFPKGYINVYPMVDEATGTLNHELNTDHFHAVWDARWWMPDVRCQSSTAGLGLTS